MISRQTRISLAAINLAWLWGMAVCMPSMAQTTDQNQIVIKNFMFAPSSLTIKAGSTVTWVNKDEEPHTVVSDTKLYRSGALDTKESFSFKFLTPGTYRFTCSIHPQMVGTILVE